MTALEDLLRESLHDRAALPKLGEDVAGTAIRGARVLRRRRLATVAIAGALAVLAAIGAVAASRPTAAPVVPAGPTGVSTAPSSGVPTTSPTATTPMTRYGIDIDLVLGDNTLLSREGREYPLGDPVAFIVRTPVGWLYAHTAGGAPILLRPDGTSATLIGIDTKKITGEFFAPVVSADGVHLAWVSDSLLHAAVLTTSGIGDVVTSPTPADTFAQTWIGSRVVVGQSYGTGCCGNRPAQYDVWDPTKGNFVPHWTKGLSPVFGPVPAGVPAFAMVAQRTGSANGCLARVDGVASMATGTPICVPGLAYGSVSGLLSPDGRHLIELSGSSLVMIDLTTVTQTRAAMGSCQSDLPFIWENNTTFVAQDTAQKKYARCLSSSHGLSVDPFPSIDPSLATEILQPVERLGS